MLSFPKSCLDRKKEKHKIVFLIYVLCLGNSINTQVNSLTWLHRNTTHPALCSRKTFMYISEKECVYVYYVFTPRMTLSARQPPTLTSYSLFAFPWPYNWQSPHITSTLQHFFAGIYQTQFWTSDYSRKFVSWCKGHQSFSGSSWISSPH